MKVTKTILNSKEISSEIDFLSDIDVPKESKRKIQEEVGELIKDHILGSVGGAKSPIIGGGWPRLNKDYAKEKAKQGSKPIANLELEGDLLDALDYEFTDTGIKIGIMTASQVPKADGHNNFSGESLLPERRFLPNENEFFNGGIKTQIREIISDALVDNVSFSRRDLSGINTKTELKSLFKSKFPFLTFGQVRNAIVSNDKSRGIFEALGLLRLLD